MSKPVLIVGSVAYDNIITPFAKGTQILGGSASYASIACSYFSQTQLVGVVGTDFDPSFIERFKKHGIDLEGLEVDESGKTFFWEGEYSEGFKTRETLAIELNVFETFEPKIPESKKNPSFVMLGNIAPSLQSHVLDEIEGNPFVLADTMDLWMNIAKEDLLNLLPRLDMLVINDEESELLTGESNVILAGQKILTMGPKMLIIKKGPNGAILFHPGGMFCVPSYPVTELRDPTGAGDSFAGAFIGHLAAKDSTDFSVLKEALFYATATASLTVEAFSLERLETAGKEALEARYKELIKLSQL